MSPVPPNTQRPSEATLAVSSPPVKSGDKLLEVDHLEEQDLDLESHRQHLTSRNRNVSAK